MFCTAHLHTAPSHRRLIMKILNSLVTAMLLIGSPIVLLAQAQSSGAYISQAVSEKSATPDLASMSPAIAANVDSTYFLAAGGRTATVFALPSNVRARPNGKIVCTITTRRRINVYRYYDNSMQWLSTNACGPSRYGVIHISQIRF